MATLEDAFEVFFKRVIGEIGHGQTRQGRLIMALDKVKWLQERVDALSDKVFTATTDYCELRQQLLCAATGHRFMYARPFQGGHMFRCWLCKLEYVKDTDDLTPSEQAVLGARVVVPGDEVMPKPPTPDAS